MFEIFLFNAQKESNYPKIFIIVFLITLILSIINHFLQTNSLFLIALISLALAYPTIKYIREEDKFELTRKLDNNSLLVRHARELGVFWTIFLAIFFALILCVSFGLNSDFSYQEKIIDNITGNFTELSSPFFSILLNNLEVAFFTFLISTLVFCGLLLVIAWNASIFTYFVYKSYGVSHNLIFILPHALLEIGGYVMIGICGSLIAYRFDKNNRFNHKFDREFVKDIIILISISFILIFSGAIIEVI